MPVPDAHARVLPICLENQDSYETFRFLPRPLHLKPRKTIYRTVSRKPDRSYEERKRISTFGDFPGMNHPSTKTYKMKVIGLVTLVVSLSAILGCGPEVATDDPGSGNTIEATTATDGNGNATGPVANVSSSGLNPAHGVPCHRCYIGVGQPLNS